MKAAVIGTGVISEEHLTFLRDSQLADLIGVCDLSSVAAEYAANRFGASKAYTDYREMLNQAKPDVVHILTPPKTHESMACDCLDAGANVICEKPIALSTDGFEALWNYAEQRDRRLMEDQNYRFNEPILEIERLVNQGELGDIIDVEVRMHVAIRSRGRYIDPNLPHPSHQLPCGVLHEFISHLSYLLLRFTGGFDRVQASWNNHANDKLFKYDDLDAFVMHKSIHGRLRFSAYAQPDVFSVTVRGNKGYAQTDLFHPYLSVFVPRAGGSNLSPMVNQWRNGLSLAASGCLNVYDKVMQRSAYEGLHTLLERTYHSLIGGNDLPISYEDMADVNRLIDALLAQENRF